jgi:purine-binding chemotaxis protein CheW
MNILKQGQIIEGVIDTQKDKYLTFQIAKEDYAIEIRNVIEIIGMLEITEVPDMPEYLIGIINLRGKVIPVIDVRTRFHLDVRDYDKRTCIIIIKLMENSVGLIVDEVSEVLNIAEENIDAPPKTMKGTRSRFIKGFGKVGKQVKIILDIDRLLNDDGVEELESVSEKAGDL